MTAAARETRLQRAGVGRRLRGLRQRSHLSMRELARRSGVAVSYVSGLEAGRFSATLATLRRLLLALGSDIGPFFADALPVPAGGVFRRSQMRIAADAGRQYTFVLPARADIGLVMLDEELFPGEKPGYESLPGDIAGYVLRGELLLDVKGEPPQILQAGDAFYVPAGVPLRGRCRGEESVRLVTSQLRGRKDPARGARP